MKKKIYSIDEAIKEIERKSKKIEKPVLVGVFSAGQNAGKSYFINKAISYFHNKIVKEKKVKDIYVASSHKENPFTNSSIRYNFDKLEFIFFHCGINSWQLSKYNIEAWNWEMNKEIKKIKEAIKYVEKIDENDIKNNIKACIKIFNLNKLDNATIAAIKNFTKEKLDITVVIYNPNIIKPNTKILVKDFDIVIENKYKK